MSKEFEHKIEKSKQIAILLTQFLKGVKTLNLKHYSEKQMTNILIIVEKGLDKIYNYKEWKKEIHIEFNINSHSSVETKNYNFAKILENSNLLYNKCKVKIHKDAILIERLKI